MLARYLEDLPVTYAHADADPHRPGRPIVRFTESWPFYHALSENDVPVRLVGIPTAHHTPRDPVRHKSYEQRILDWFAQHLR